MNLVEKEIKIRDERFILTNQRAMYWPNESAIILSDLHLGKTAHFRKNCIALPSDLIEKDLERLTQIIQNYSAEKLIIVGDFLHAGKNSEFELFKNFKNQFEDLKIILIKGNHDRISEKNFLDLGITEIHSTYSRNNLLFSHENVRDDSNFVISGHLHPGVRLKLTTKKYQKLPCYIVTDHQLILPAFSSFTGLYTHDYFPNSKKYIIDDNFIMLLS